MYTTFKLYSYLYVIFLRYTYIVLVSLIHYFSVRLSNCRNLVLFIYLPT